MFIAAAYALSWPENERTITYYCREQGALVINNNLFSTIPQFCSNCEPLGKRGFDIKRGIVRKLIRQFVINCTSFVYPSCFVPLFVILIYQLYFKLVNYNYLSGYSLWNQLTYNEFQLMSWGNYTPNAFGKIFQSFLVSVRIVYTYLLQAYIIILYYNPMK